MEDIEVPLIHEHPLLPFTRFDFSYCRGCRISCYIYGGYRCNELGCDTVVFHKECGKLLPEINLSCHPDHPLMLKKVQPFQKCSLCEAEKFDVGYSCSKNCSFILDLNCAKIRAPLHTFEESNAHEHPLQFYKGTMLDSFMSTRECKACNKRIQDEQKYMCRQCNVDFHLYCVDFGPEAYHTSHTKHPLKFLKSEATPSYADKKCLLCAVEFAPSGRQPRLHHCEICNFSICDMCMRNPPPVYVVSWTTHEHKLHLIPRRIDFTCNACGTQGDRSPYFCLECNFMIHWECIDLPRVININRHDHRISYTRRLGDGNRTWTCGVCRKKVDGFYGAYSCSKCSSFVVHSRCAIRKDVWDMVELEGIPEEPEELAPFEVIDENTVKHFSHDHNLRINKDGQVLHDRIVCKACAFQICSESFYNCEQCDFRLHEKCANVPRKRRHVCNNLPYRLQTSYGTALPCELCGRRFNGFKYATTNRYMGIDIRCGSISEPFVHGSHPHPLYYSTNNSKSCSECGERGRLSCDECDFNLDYTCALLPEKVVRHRYDDHPLCLSYGESSVDGEYWCEACETKVNPSKWFYTCNDCGTVLHISCVVGDFSFVMTGPCHISGTHQEVVPNTSICRTLCAGCNNRCKLPSILKGSKDGVVAYFCSLKCM